MEIHYSHTAITSVERAKEKARKLINQIAAVYQTTSILIGKVKEVKLEKLWSMGILFCRIRLKNVKKFDLEGKLLSETDEEIVYINRPEFVLDLKELEKANPKVFKSYSKLLNTLNKAEL